MTHAEQVEDDIYDFVGSLAAQAPKVEIWQVNRDGRAFCDSLPYDTIREDVLQFLRQEFGPGKWLLIFKTGGKYIARKTIVIAALKGDASISASRAAAPQSVGRDDPVQILREQNQQSRDLLAAVIAGQRGPDMGGIMSGLAAVVAAGAPILAALMRRPDADPSQTIAALASAMKDMRPPEAAQSPVETARAMLELARDIGGGEGGGERDWVDQAISAVPKVIEGLAAAGRGNPAPAAVAALPEAKAPEGAIMDEREQLVRYMVNKAIAGSDPGLWADWLIDERGSNKAAAWLVSVCEVETWESIDAQLRGRGMLVSLLPWFRALYDAIREEPGDAKEPEAKTG
jgi:hypothetical protein